MNKARKTTDHYRIRSWIEAREGRPARIGIPGDGGQLTIDFRQPDEKLEPISWQEFQNTFDKKKLAFLFQDKTYDGRRSLFHKFVDRHEV